MRAWYEPKKNRPDIPKNAKKKKGVVGFLEIFWREFFALIGLNMVFIVTSLPIITIPASLTAMSRITATMVQDKNHFLIADYWRAFKRDFGKSLLGGIVLLLSIVIFAFATWFYYSLGAQSSKLYLILTIVSGCLMLMAVLCGIYFFSMLAIVDQNVKTLLKNSYAMIGSGLKNSLFALFYFLLFFGLFGIGLLPYSVFYMVIMMFSLTSLLTSYFTVPAIEKHVLKIPEVKEDAEKEEDPNSSEYGEFPELESADYGEFPELDESVDADEKQEGN